MYIEYKIHSLSPLQQRKLHNIEKVRMKPHHNGVVVYLTKDQIDLLSKNPNKGHLISFSPSQVKYHLKNVKGQGLFDKLKSLARKHKDIVNPIIKTIKNTGHKVISKGSKYLHNKVESIPSIEGEGVVSDVLNVLSQGSKMLGFGMKKRGRPCGKGILTNLVKKGAKALAPAVIDAGANLIKDKIQGMGTKRRGRPKKTTTEAKPKKPRKTTTKKPRKTTTKKPRKSTRKVKGTALFPAGSYGGKCC